MTNNYFSQAEVNVIIECMHFAIEQVKTSNGKIQVFDAYNTLAGETTLREQLEMAEVASSIADRLINLINHEAPETIIIE